MFASKAADQAAIAQAAAKAAAAQAGAAAQAATQAADSKLAAEATVATSAWEEGGGSGGLFLNAAQHMPTQRWQHLQPARRPTARLQTLDNLSIPQVSTHTRSGQ